MEFTDAELRVLHKALTKFVPAPGARKRALGLLERLREERKRRARQKVFPYRCQGSLDFMGDPYTCLMVRSPRKKKRSPRKKKR